MSIIQKRADELKPGDVIAGSAAYGLRVVVESGPSETREGFAAVRVFHNNALDWFSSDPARQFDTEVRDLTPAQQHAEEMLDLLCDVYAPAVDPQNLIPQRIKALLDKIKPPEPPTLEEALAELDALRKHAHSCGAFDQARSVERSAVQMLYEARRAGVKF